MKSIIAIMLVVSLSGAYSEVKGDRIVLSQNFNTALTWTPTGDLIWVKKDSVLNLDGTSYAKLIPFTSSNNVKSGTLTSQQFDASLCSDLYIDFDHKALFSGSGTQGTLEYTSDGTNWTQIYINTVTVGDWNAPEHKTILIPVRTATMKVRFIGSLKGKTGSTWNLDNIVIHGTDRIPDVPVLVSPADNAYSTNLRPVFDWLDALAATSYTILADNNSDFSSPEINQIPTSSTYTPGTDLAAGTYYWKVRSTNTYGSSVYSAVRTLNLGYLPVSPSLLSPANGIKTSDHTPDFDWSDVPGATSYTLLADNNSDFSSPEIFQNRSVSDYTPVSDLSTGIYYWKVSATSLFGTGSYSSVRTVDIGNVPNLPVLISPADEAVTYDLTPDFDWSDVPGAALYTILIDDDFDFSSPVINQTPAVSNYTPVSDLSTGTYYWKVSATNDYGTSSYTLKWSLNIGTEPLLPAVPSPVYPDDGSFLTDRTPDFDWTDVSTATSYTIMVDNNPDFSSPEIIQSPTASNYTPVSDLADGVYYWKVLATNGNGSSSYCVTRAFNVGSTPSVPVLMTPADGICSADHTPVFDWEDAQGASEYEILVDNDSDFSSPEIDQFKSVSGHTALTVLENGIYYWKVRSHNDFGWSDFSSVWILNIGDPPSIPSPVYPSDSSVSYDLTPTFVWLPVSGASDYILTVDNSSEFDSPEIYEVITDTTFTCFFDLPSVTYYWKICAANDYGTSCSSPVFSFTLMSLDTPSYLITSVSGAVFVIDWNAVTGATDYDVYSSDDPYGSYTLTSTVQTNQYRVPYSAAQKKFYYIRAVNNSK